MAVTIHVNGKSNSLVHKGSMGIAKSTLPDVCKTPSPGGPVPVPYPVIVSMSSDLKKGTKTVKVDGKNPAAVKGSEFSRCTGDEPGTAGGVKSSTNMKEATWLLYSFDVKLDGKNACRLSDKMMMNHGNTVCLGGVFQPVVVGKPGQKVNCKKCGKQVTVNPPPSCVVRKLPSKEEPQGPFELLKGHTGCSVYARGKLPEQFAKKKAIEVSTSSLEAQGFEVVQTHACGEQEPAASNHYEIRAKRTKKDTDKKQYKRTKKKLAALRDNDVKKCK